MNNFAKFTALFLQDGPCVNRRMSGSERDAESPLPGVDEDEVPDSPLPGADAVDDVGDAATLLHEGGVQVAAGADEEVVAPAGEDAASVLGKRREEGEDAADAQAPTPEAAGKRSCHDDVSAKAPAFEGLVFTAPDGTTITAPRKVATPQVRPWSPTCVSRCAALRG